MGAAVELNFNIPLLNFTNWFTWKTDVKVCLLHHGAWQYIESSDVVDEKPTAETSKETTDVNLRKIRAYTIIYQHVSPELRPLISATTDGKIAWNILHEHFEPSTRARVIQLLDEFFAIRHQPGMDLGLFLCHIKNAAARLREAGHELPSLYFGYQMIRSLPVEYQPIVQTIYRWSDKEFTPDKIEQELLLEQNRLMQVETDLSTETVFFSKQNKYKTGADIDSLITYAKRPNRITLPNPASLPRSSMSRILQAGEKRSLPSYIPDYFPPFPDPHTYIRTPTHRQPLTDYEIIREKAATQKRDTERALTKFIAKTGPTNSLYPDDASLFPLIACKPISNPFFSALLFTDQVFDKEEPDVANNQASNQYSAEDSETPKDANPDVDIMDNPYLRPAKLQRKRRK